MGFLTNWHFEGRHSRNLVPSGIDELRKAPWVKVSRAESVYHDNKRGKAELKFIRKDEDSFLGLGGHEAVWDPDAEALIRRGPYRATYNYVNPGRWTRPSGWARNAGHLVFDVVPYWLGGAERGDEGTSFFERVTGK